MMRLYVVTATAHLVEWPRITSRLVKMVYPGYMFHGCIAGKWVRRLGGGYCWRGSVEEVV